MIGKYSAPSFSDVAEVTYGKFGMAVTMIISDRGRVLAPGTDF
jgi:hypothetical protein